MQSTKGRERKQTSTFDSTPLHRPELSHTKLKSKLVENMQLLKAVIYKSADIVITPIKLFDKRSGTVVYVEGLSKMSEINEHLIQPLVNPIESKFAHRTKNPNIEKIAEEYISISEWDIVETIGELVKRLMEQHAVLLVDGQSKALVVSVADRRDRSLNEPDTESLIRGPREGFNENISTSISLIRRRLPTPNLKIERKRIGEYTKTDVCVLYIDGIVDYNLVDEIHERINRIKTDAILDSSYIEEFIEDNPYSPFPQIQNSERPDTAVAALLEGRIVILVDGSPFSLIAPVNFWTAIQAAEDQYERYLIVNFIRILRYMFLFFALFLPATYVAITTFHPEMLPTRLLMTVAAAREVTPLPAVLEALLMEITFEILREAGVRLPKAVGPAISIVGALVIGQAAVQAGMASAPMVIIVAFTGIASFAIPRYNFAIAVRMLRFPMIILAGTLGIFGMVIGLLAIIIHVSSLRSLGKPYLQPISPLTVGGIKDTITRSPRWAMKKRPEGEARENPIRQSGRTRPSHRIPEPEGAT